MAHFQFKQFFNNNLFQQYRGFLYIIHQFCSFSALYISPFLQIQLIVILIEIIVIGQTPGVARHPLSGTATGVPLPVETRDQRQTMAQAMVSLNLGILWFIASVDYYASFVLIGCNEYARETLVTKTSKSETIYMLTSVRRFYGQYSLINARRCSCMFSNARQWRSVFASTREISPVLVNKRSLMLANVRQCSPILVGQSAHQYSQVLLPIKTLLTDSPHPNN